MSDVPFALEPREAALNELGFVVVERLDDGFVAMRRQWHWDVFSRLTTLVRVRRVSTLSQGEMPPGQAELRERFRAHDTGRIPRGFQHAWVLVDVWLADGAEPEALAYAERTMGKGFAQGWHPVIVTDERVAYQTKALYGRAFWPKTQHVIEAAALGRHGPEPSSGLGVILGLIMAMNALVVGLMCCGLPIVGWIIAAATEPPLTALDGETD